MAMASGKTAQRKVAGRLLLKIGLNDGNAPCNDSGVLRLEAAGGDRLSLRRPENDRRAAAGKRRASWQARRPLTLRRDAWDRQRRFLHHHQTLPLHRGQHYVGRDYRRELVAKPVFSAKPGANRASSRRGRRRLSSFMTGTQ